MLLNVIAAPGDAFAAMRHLLTDNDEEPRRRSAATSAGPSRSTGRCSPAAWSSGSPSPDADGRTVRLTVDLQDDFALNQPLSPFALAVLELLDRESPDYALDVLSVIESTLDDPRQVLSAQQFKARGEAVAAMKADGIEYEERMARWTRSPTRARSPTCWSRVRDLPQGPPVGRRPRGRPEVGGARHVRARDDLHRVRLVLRAVPLRRAGAAVPGRRVQGGAADGARGRRRPRSSIDLIEWLGELVRQVDSSLIDEWEKLRNPTRRAGRCSTTAPPAVTRNVRAFRVLVRNALFRRVELAALRRYDELGELDAEAGWDADAWEDAMEAYFDEYDDLGVGPDARGPALVDIRPGRATWPSGRPSTTRPATGTGASAPRSTSPRPTRRARPSCGSSAWDHTRRKAARRADRAPLWNDRIRSAGTP